MFPLAGCVSRPTVPAGAAVRSGRRRGTSGASWPGRWVRTRTTRPIAAPGWLAAVTAPALPPSTPAPGSGSCAAWQTIVGDQVAEHCTIESFEAGRITLRASSSSWAQQLRLLQPTIEARIVEALRSGPGGRQAGGISTGDGVELRILGPAGPSWKRRGVGLRGARGPRDTYG